MLEHKIIIEEEKKSCVNESNLRNLFVLAYKFFNSTDYFVSKCACVSSSRLFSTWTYISLTQLIMDPWTTFCVYTLFFIIALFIAYKCFFFFIIFFLSSLTYLYVVDFFFIFSVIFPGFLVCAIYYQHFRAQLKWSVCFMYGSFSVEFYVG